MYKTIFLFLGFSAMTVSVNSQSLVPFPPFGLVQGEVKHGDWTDPGYTDATFHRIEDTLIGGTIYNRFVSPSPLNNFYSRYDNGKVFEVSTNGDGSLSGYELLLYDFNLGVGDTFPGGYIGDCIVDSVGTIVLLNGETRKYMELDGYYGPHKWIDGIGDIERGFQYYMDWEGGGVDFVCHTDSSGLIYLNDQIAFDCDSLTYYESVGIEGASLKPTFGVYPNPASADVHVCLDTDLTVGGSLTIYNAYGTVVYTEDLISANTTINIAFLENGIYTILLSSGSVVSFNRFVKI